MPPKRRGAQAKTPAPANKPAPPDPPKPTPSSKPVPTAVAAPTPIPQQPQPQPQPQQAPPPPQPLETGAARVRKEWSKFMDAWYEPQKKKLVEKVKKDLLVKYRSLGSAKETQKQREMELYEELDSIARQLAQPARAEWERRLELAQLREEQWDDVSGEEQQAVMNVFVGIFADDVSIVNEAFFAYPAEEDSIIEEPPYRAIPSQPPPAPSASPKQPIPPTPTRGNFEFVNPTSFFVETMTPLNPTKHLPALSMDHLATLGPSNSARSAEPPGGGVGGTPGFQNWASEAGILTQHPQGLSAKLPPLAAPTSAQPASARARATDNMSRQASAASNLSSSPQYSPPNPTTKFSPPINTESLPLGKRYIGPIITEEEPDPMDEELLKSRMADDYQQFKISLRIQMIYQFHAEAADIEIKLFESLLAVEGTKESRARAVHEHESSMMRLREQKEEERKRLCSEERERRREEMRQHLAQRRATQAREADPGPKASPPAPLPDKASVPQRQAKVTHQKENIPLAQAQPATPTPAKLEAPGVIRKSNSTLSQGEASANEALFANAMAMMAQGKPGAAGLTPAQASSNEALFSKAAASLAVQGQPSTLQPPSIMKKSNSSRSQEYDVPHITVSFAESPIIVPEPAQVPPATVRGKKGKKGLPAVQPPPAKSVTISEEPEMVEEPPPPMPSLLGTASAAFKYAWEAASTSVPTSKLSVSVEEDEDADLTMPSPAPAPSKGAAGAKRATPATKKGKVTITEEPDVDADPIVSPPTASKAKTATRGGWGTVNGKSKLTPSVVEESVAETITPPPPTLAPVASGWGKKAAQAAATAQPLLKPQLKVAISEEQESEVERSAAPAWTTTSKAKSAWEMPAAAVPSANGSMQARGKRATQQQAEPRRGGMTPGSKSVRADLVPEVPETTSMVPSESEEVEEEGGASGWLNPEDMNYWASVMGGPSKTETLAVPEVTEQTGKHVRWTPKVHEESDDEEGFGETDEHLATDMWMQFAISGGDMSTLGGDAPEVPRVIPSESARGDASVRERGTSAKLTMNPATGGDSGNRVQQTSVFDRAAFTGQWPKMDNWLSPPSRGQSSGSTRVF